MTIPQNLPVLHTLFALLENQRAAFGQQRIYWRVVALLIAEVLAVWHHRVTDLLRAVGCQHQEWSAWYRLLSQPGRFEEERVAHTMLRESLTHVPAQDWYVVGVDGTQVWRDSQTMEGTSWLKCPRNPPFQVGIHRAQRFLNGSWLTPISAGFSRAIPLRWLPSFPAKAVSRDHPPQTEHQAGLVFVQWVRQQLDQQGRATQRVLCLGDGNYDKVEFWRGLSHDTHACVRTAKNRVLKHLPTPDNGRGRQRRYGTRALAPQDYLAQRDGWHTHRLAVRGRQRRMVYRVEGPFLRETAPDVPLMLVCVRGQHWRGGKKQQRRAAHYYLINAVQVDGQWQLPLPIEQLLAWLWQRWELEVTHRESKALLGLGDKQCWNDRAAVSSVQWSAWVYALVMLTGYRLYGLPAAPAPTAAWYRHPKRWTLTTILQHCRAELLSQPDFRGLLTSSADNWQKFEAFLQRQGWATCPSP